MIVPTSHGVQICIWLRGGHFLIDQSIADQRSSTESIQRQKPIILETGMSSGRFGLGDLPAPCQ